MSWYNRVHRWGQTNLTETDPRDCSVDFWREHWKQTATEGIIVNAGGIVAYYPSSNPMQTRARFSGERDLFGEFVQAAREDGLAVLARMDSNRAPEPVFRAHPEWFAVDADGKPFQSGNHWLTCINSTYYKDHIPSILAEIITRYRPDGFYRH